MKNLKRITILRMTALLLSSVIFCACSKENSQVNKEVTTVIRQDFLKDKDFASIKSDFNVLDEDKKIALWDEKLSQVLSQNLSAHIKEQIKKLKIEINKEVIDPKSISDISLSLATNIPEEDFLSMFTTLEDYNFRDTFTGRTKVSSEILNDLRSLNYNYESNSVKSNPLSRGVGLKDCNCNWTCGLYAGGSTSKCKTTTSGCGFLWAFDCENRVGPTLEELPNPEDSDSPIELE